MSRLYFKYGCMNSSKSANLLMIRHNYIEQGFRVLLLKPKIDTRDGDNIIRSRIGIEAECIMIDSDVNILNMDEIKNSDIIMVDEAQFLTAKQVDQLYEITMHTNVLCFGLLTDFRQQLFEGSKRLIERAESLMEIKTVCKCGAKATVNVRYSGDGKLLTEGEQVDIGGNDRYKAMCKKCYASARKEAIEWKERQA